MGKIMVEKNLIISPTVDGVFAREWVKGNCNFDIILLYYLEDEDGYNELSKDFKVFRVNSEKWQNIKMFLDANVNLIEQYDNFWFVDDDIRIDTESINNLFRIHSENKLSLSQPAMTGYTSFDIVKPQPYLLRMVSFVEIMCPLMSKECLKTLIHTFGITESGWGLDFLWGKILEHKNMAIIDKVIAEHTRPVGYNYEKRFKVHPVQTLSAFMQDNRLEVLITEYEKRS